MSLRRTGAVVVPLLLAVSTLAACGGGGTVSVPKDGEGISGSITVRMYPLAVADSKVDDQAYWNTQIAAFKAKYPKANVKVEVKPWKDRDTALTVAIAGRTAPDVVYMIPDELAQFHSKGVVEPLNGIVKSDGYRKSAVDAVTYDGKMYGAPILMSIVPSVCDAKVLKEVGVDNPPTTWDELMALGPKFKAKGKYVTEVIASNEATLNTTFYPWVWQAGGAPFDENGKAQIDSPAMVEAAAFLAELTAKGFVNKNDVSTSLPLEQTAAGRREVGCIYDRSPSWIKGVWGEDMIVAAPLTNKVMAAYGTVGSLTVLKGSANKKLAAAWVQFVTTNDGLAGVGKLSQLYPPKGSAPMPFAADSQEAVAAKYLDIANVGPRVAHASEVQGLIAPQVQGAVLGKKSAEQAMNDAAKAAEPVLAR